MMTLEEFRATGQDVHDLGMVLSDSRWEPKTQQGRLYVGCLYIERRPAEGWENGDPHGWFLSADPHEEWLSDDLPRLEALLYEWALANGYFEKQD
jgi:hypothetical protein